jgi:hypothetical protein
MLPQAQVPAADPAYLSCFDCLASRRLGPGRAVHAAARVLGPVLDSRLAAGADPGASALLAARAASLTSRRARRALAGELEHAVASARGPQRRWWAAPARQPVRENEQELLALASLLRSKRPLYAAGVAAARALASDGTGPMYGPRGAHLALALRDVREAMIEGPPGLRTA